MRKERTVRLLKPVRRQPGDQERKSKADTVSWEGVDKGLFEELRLLRRQLADAKGAQPYIIFSDATLRELARVRPSTQEAMRLIYGVGDAKLREFGNSMLGRIQAYCRDQGLLMDQAARPPKREQPVKAAAITGPRAVAFDLFRAQAAIEDVMHQTGRARGTIMDYLADFIRLEKAADISTWVPRDLYDQIAAEARKAGLERLKPIFIGLGEKVPYDMIRLVVAHLSR